MKRFTLNHPVTTLRRGSLLIETIVAAIILSSAISMLVPAMTAIRHQRQSHRFETLAMIELKNIAEFLPLTENAESQPALSDWFQMRYSGARFESEILPRSVTENSADLRAVRLTIHRPTVPSMPEQKVSIVVWQRIPEQTP